MKTFIPFSIGNQPVRTMLLSIALCSLSLAGTAHADALHDLLSDLSIAGAGPFSAADGEALWLRDFSAADGTTRACTSCHTAVLRQPGKHAVTGKTIAPMAPSAEPKRLSDRREMEKWLTRNCKWTLGRECSAQEKGDLLMFMKAQ